MPENKIEELELQISSVETALDLPQTSVQRNRSQQLLFGLREQLESEKRAEARRRAVNPEGLKRRTGLCERLNLPLDSPARQVFQALLGIAEAPHKGQPSFVEDHFTEQDYIDAMEEFVTDPSVSDSDREEAAKLLANLKESFRPGEPQAATEPAPPQSQQDQNQPKGSWQPSDGTPGKAAEPQSSYRRFEPVKTTIGGNVANVVFNNPGAKA